MTKLTSNSDLSNKQKQARKESDLSQQILREIFQCSDDFSTPQRKTITPEIAEKLLRHNTRNRNIKPAHVLWLAEQMKRGLWAYNGKQIIMTVDGALADGQHTLTALIRAGFTCDFNIQGGFPPSIISKIGGDIGRTAGDTLSIHRFKNANNLAAIIRRVVAFKNKYHSKALDRKAGGAVVHASAHSGNTILTNSTVLQMATNDMMFTEATEMAGKFYKIWRVLTQSQYGMLYYLFAEKSTTGAAEFLTKFAKGSNLPESSPIYVLRKKMEREMMSEAKHPPKVVMLWFFYCWNKYRKGESLKSIPDLSKYDETPELL